MYNVFCLYSIKAILYIDYDVLIKLYFVSFLFLILFFILLMKLYTEKSKIFKSSLMPSTNYNMQYC